MMHGVTKKNCIYTILNTLINQSQANSYQNSPKVKLYSIQ